MILAEALPMPTYQPGDHVKAEFKDEQTGESEWMWVKVDRCDEEKLSG